MFKRVMVFVILASMMLHCASRMNFLSYMVEHRDEIAFKLGFITEIPIAFCHHDYDFNKGLVFEMHDEEKSSLPSAILKASEIILFCQSSFFSLDTRLLLLAANHCTVFLPKKYTTPGFPVFHPPALL